MNSVKTYTYFTNQRVYELNQFDQLVFHNSMNMYEPFDDYTFSHVPPSVIHHQDNHRAGVEEGESGSVREVFTFNELGTFTMMVTEHYTKPVSSKIITIIVEKPFKTPVELPVNPMNPSKNTKPKKQCTIL